MKELFEILCSLSEDKRNIIIENLDESVSKELLTELKGRAEGPWKSYFKNVVLRSAPYAVIAPSVLSVVGIPILIPIALYDLLLGRIYAKRINSGFYQCRRIKNKGERLVCQRKFLEFLISATREAKSKTENDKYTRKLNKALVSYKKALSRVDEELAKYRATMQENAKDLAEATSMWRIGLPISLDAISPVLGSRIDRMWHYCREFPRGVKRYNCLLKVVVEMKKILQTAIANKDKNSKEYRKVSERIGRLEALERRYKEKLIELT